MKEIYIVLLFNSKHVLHIPSLRIANLMYCRSHFSNITFIDAKTKYRRPYLLDISHTRTSLGRTRDVSKRPGHFPWS